MLPSRSADNNRWPHERLNPRITPMTNFRRLGLSAILAACVVWPGTAEARYPIASRFTRTANGPYQPQLRRYVVVDPKAAAMPGHAGPHDVAQHQVLWERHDAAVPAYPYGWFGARAATQNYTRTGYYDNYWDNNILRGR